MIDNLDVAVFTVDALSLLTRLKSFDMSNNPTIVSTKGIAQRHQRGKAVASEDILKCGLNVESSGNVISTNLEVTAITIGGVAYLTTSRNVKLAVKTNTDEAKALATLKKSANAGGTDYSVETELMISAAGLHALETIAYGTTVLDRELTVAFTFGGIAFAAPMVLGTVSRVGEEEKIQVVKIQLEGNGLPTGPAAVGVGFQALLYTMLLGTAQFAVVLGADGTASFASEATRKAMLIDLSIEAGMDAVIKADCTFQFSGGGTIA